jgi:hypothetical protein
MNAENKVALERGIRILGEIRHLAQQRYGCSRLEEKHLWNLEHLKQLAPPVKRDFVRHDQYAAYRIFHGLDLILVQRREYSNVVIEYVLGRWIGWRLWTSQRSLYTTTNLLVAVGYG